MTDKKINDILGHFKDKNLVDVYGPNGDFVGLHTMKEGGLFTLSAVTGRWVPTPYDLSKCTFKIVGKQADL